MRTSIRSGDVIHERQHMVVVGIYELERDLSQTFISFHIDVMLGRKRLLFADQVSEPCLDASFEEESLFESGFLIHEIEGDARRQICALLHPCDLYRLRKFHGFKYERVRHEFDAGSYFVAFAYLFDLSYRDASFKSLEILFAVSIYGDFQSFTQGIDYGSAHSVETSRYLIYVLIEFTSSMQNSEDRF